MELHTTYSLWEGMIQEALQEGMAILDPFSDPPNPQILLVIQLTQTDHGQDSERTGYT